MDSNEKRIIGKVSRRLIPFVIICYFVAYLDRVNLSFAALEMNKDLKFSSTVYGIGAGAFFLSYFLLETPSNLVLLRWARVGGLRASCSPGASCRAPWRSSGTSRVSTSVRFLFGAAEAGFFPGILYYLTLYFPAAYRARMVSMFMVAIPVSAVIGAPLSTSVLYMDGFLGLRGWQWVFISEAIPALILAIVTWFYMTESPAVANWLEKDEREWLVKRQAAEVRQIEAAHGMSVWKVITNPKVLVLGLVGYGIANEIYGTHLFLTADRQTVRLDQHANRSCFRDPFRRRGGRNDLVRKTLRPASRTA